VSNFVTVAPGWTAEVPPASLVEAIKGKNDMKKWVKAFFDNINLSRMANRRIKDSLLDEDFDFVGKILLVGLGIILLIVFAAYLMALLAKK